MSKITYLKTKGETSYDRAINRAYARTGINYSKLLFVTDSEKFHEKRKESALNNKLSYEDSEFN